MLGKGTELADPAALAKAAALLRQMQSTLPAEVNAQTSAIALACSHVCACVCPMHMSVGDLPLLPDHHSTIFAEKVDL